MEAPLQYTQGYNSVERLLLGILLLQEHLVVQLNLESYSHVHCDGISNIIRPVAVPRLPQHSVHDGPVPGNDINLQIKAFLLKIK